MFDLRFGVWTSQSKPWEETLAEWMLIEELGFDCAGIVDHFMPTGGNEDGWFHEGWTLLTALATLTPNIRRVAILVSGNNYRNPALLAKQAATLDHIIGGRVDFGIGAGWFAREYEAYGWELPPAGVRVEMLDEALQLIKLLWTQQRTTFDGRYYQLDDAPFEPKPLQTGGLPIMIGAQKPKMLGLIAKHAEIWNLNHSPAAMREFGRVLDEQCRAIGRDPLTVRRSAFGMTSAIGYNPFENLDNFRRVTEDYLASGGSEIYFRMPEQPDYDVLRRAAELMPEYRAAYATGQGWKVQS